MSITKGKKISLTGMAICLIIIANLFYVTDTAATMYVAHDRANRITAYSIDAETGILQEINIGKVETGGGPVFILSVLDKYIYVGNSLSYDISMYSIQADNTLTPLSPPTIRSTSPWALTADPSSQYLYVSNEKSVTISQYEIDRSTGNLISLDPVTVNTGMSPGLIGFDPLITPYAYVPYTRENKAETFAFDVSTGQLTNTNVAAETGGIPLGVWFDYAHHAYTINNISNTISMFYANPTDGQLEPLNPSYVSTGGAPSAFATDSTSQYAYVTASLQNRIYMYKINSAGILEALNPAYVATGAIPQAIAVDKNNHLYVINSAENTISMYQIDPNTGLLASLNPPKITTFGTPYTATIVYN